MIPIHYTVQRCWTGFSLNIVHCSTQAFKPNDRSVGCALASCAFACYCNHKSCHTRTHTHTHRCTLSHSLHPQYPILSCLLACWIIDFCSHLHRQADRQLIYCSYCLSIWQQDKRTLCVSMCMCAHLCVTVCACAASSSNISSNLWFISPPPHPITIHTWSSEHLFYSLSFLSFFLSFLHSSQYLLGTPETSLRGLSTLNALRALTSKPAAFPPIGVAPSPLVACSKIALNNLQDRM